MADEKDANGGAWSRVPTWDGSPQTWRPFRREMAWWLAGLDVQSTKKYNLAARWLLRQSGVVRQRGEEFDPSELEYKRAVMMPNPATGDDEEVEAEDPLSRINKLLDALEAMTGRTSLDKRGDLRNVFYLELKRKSGERIAEFATRFRVLVSELKSEGVVIDEGELGWWFKRKLGLDALRSQLLETALGGAEDYPTIEREVLRLFKDLHVADPLYRRSQDGDQRTPMLQKAPRVGLHHMPPRLPVQLQGPFGPVRLRLRPAGSPAIVGHRLSRPWFPKLMNQSTTRVKMKKP